MRNHRIAIGAGIRAKVREIGFFAGKVTELSRVIECAHILEHYPLNKKIDELNYYFNGFLNAIQSIKDGCQTAMDIKVSWLELSPTYGPFIYYCRNSVTHDGSCMINAGADNKNYIMGPLRRISNRGAVIEIYPPCEDVLSITCLCANEVLESIKKIVFDYGSKIPVLDADDYKNSFGEIVANEFIPCDIRQIITDSREEILEGFKRVDVDLIAGITKEIKSIQANILSREF